MACLFIFLIVSFDEQKILILIKINFLFMIISFCELFSYTLVMMLSLKIFF